jgi:hypothetical protein
LAAVIRFLPDDWVDIVMRPFDMVSPEANTYVEIAAPDVRLAAAVLLVLAVLLLWRKRAGTARATAWLLALLAASAAIWLGTTGNGRYFIAWLVLLGPLCLGLVRLLPTSAGRKFFLASALIAAQLFVLAENSPWGSWTWVEWDDAPYFQVETPPTEPATYVTIANISYSLLAPQFPADSRWVGLGGGIAKRDAPVVDKILSTSTRLTLLVPAITAETRADGRPSAAAAEALSRLLKPHGLSLRGSEQCRHLASEGMQKIVHRQRTAPPAAKYGFWLCPLQYHPVAAPQPGEEDPAAKAVFQAVERMCPRFFAGDSPPLQISGGWVKHYDSDTKVYVLDDGSAYYKFWRSLNAVKIGTAEEIRSNRASIDCSKIRAPNWRRGGP